MCDLREFKFLVTRLWRYFGIYFLKPHDAVNDTVTSFLITRFDWTGKFLEIGSGDGMFSYLMHGGIFPFSFDRYGDTDLKKSDIFEKHTRGKINPRKTLSYPNILASVDAKKVHVEKIKEINFSKSGIVATYENLPFEDESQDNIFFYTPHGVSDHAQAFNEAVRVLKPGGRMIILRYDTGFAKAFVCKNLGSRFNGRIGKYFQKLDGGRFDEITLMAQNEQQWKNQFVQHGLAILGCYSGLSHFAWRVYDVQTRPILKGLVTFFDCLPKSFRAILKFLWMICLFPYLLLFLLTFAKIKAGYSEKSCYVAFHLYKEG